MHKKNLVPVALYGFTALIPGLAMLAAHWFPWRVVLGRDLGRIECYIWGTGWIIGIAGAAMRLSQRLDAPLTPDQSARMAEVAATSAGIATVGAYLIDFWGTHRRNGAAARIVAEAKKHAAEW